MAKEIVEILTELGFQPKLSGNCWRMKRLYADGDNPTALAVFPDGSCYDFVDSSKFSFDILIQKTLKLLTPEDSKLWLENQKFSPPVIKTIPKIKMQKVFDKENLKRLVPDHSYWVNRGISRATLEVFNGGISLTGGSKDRYVFPVFNSKNEVVGFAARDITGTKTNKWKLFGEKKNFVWPAYINLKNVKESKQVVLVESIGDFLALWEAGIKTGIVLFGADISVSIINFILLTSPDKIIVSTNNDSDFRDSAVGNHAAVKIRDRLTKYIEDRKVKIILPNKAKDWNEQLLSHGAASIKEQFV